MALHIENCINKYKELFISNRRNAIQQESNVQQESDVQQEPNFQQELAIRNKTEKYERFFFKEMNEAIFSGEYLINDYIDKLEEFENVLTSNDNYFSYLIRNSIKDLKDIVFRIQNKIKISNDDIFMALRSMERTVQPTYVQNFIYISSWKSISLYLLYIDHVLIKDNNITETLISIFHEIDAKLNGLDNADIITTFNKLKSKCSFLLKKLFTNDVNAPHKYSVNFVIKNISQNIRRDDYNNSFYDLYDQMVNKRIDNETINKYQDEFSRDIFSSKGFIILAYHYRTSENKNIHRLDNLSKQFDKYLEQFKSLNTNPCKFDIYALNTVKNFIENCRFSLLLKQKDFKREDLHSEIIKIEAIQDNTGCQNYHPYKKALKYLDEFISDNDKTEDYDISKLSDDYIYIFNKYKTYSEKCIKNSFHPFQLTLKDCMTKEDENGIFIASSFVRPISPVKLNESEQNFKDTTQYLRIRKRLSNKEKELKELTSKFESFRKESFQYIGIFIAIITFLFGSIQIFAKVDQVPTDVMLKNITSLGLVLILFMTLLYIIVDKRKNKLLYLSLLALALLIILSFCL